MAAGLFAGVITTSAQLGPFTIPNNSNLVITASTLVTNLTGSSNHMVGAVEPTSAQGGSVSLISSQQWVQRYNGPANNEDQAMAITVDKDGNIIVGGYSTGIGSGLDFLTIKYSPNGAGIWTNRFNGSGNGDDKIDAVATDGSAGVYVAGNSGGITTIKYAANGTAVWTNTYSSTAMFMFFTGLAVDSNGNAYVESVDADSDAFVTIKYDVNGNPAWTNYFKTSSTSQESAADIAVDAAGHVFVTGSTFDSYTGSGCLTVKFASDGSVLWANRFVIDGVGGSGGSGERVLVDQQQNILVAVDMHSIYGNRYAVVKYSNAGAALWTNVVTAVNYAGGGVPQITVDPLGSVFLVGGTPGATTADFTMFKYSSAGVPLWTNRFVDPNAGAQEFYGARTDNAGNLYCEIESGSPSGSANFNYVTVKYAANGTALWTNRYNGPGNAADSPRAMATDKAGGVYVTGTSASSGTGFSVLDFATVKYADLLRYVPPPDFVGQDTILYTIFNAGYSATGTMTVNVTPGVYITPGVAVPAAYASGAGNGGLNTLVRSTGAPRTYQMQFTSAALGGLPTGARITGVCFRISTNSTTGFPSNTVTWADYEIQMAQAANPVGSMSTTFAANMLNPVLVKDGVLSIAANQFAAGSSPNAFSTFTMLDTPYVYQGGDLVIQFSHTGSDSAENAFLDAASSAAPGYGTSFRAISANTFEATTGAAATATIVHLLFTPTVTQTMMASGNQAVITGGGGFAGTTYRILTATNIALPAIQWQPIATNRFGAGGDFSYTNSIQPGTPGRYFRVSVP